MPRNALFALFAVAIAATAGALVARSPGRESPPARQQPAAAAIVPEKEGPFRGNELPGTLRGKRAPGFNLSDARGKELDSAALAGRPYALTFLYTDCTDVCPLIGQELRRAFALLGRRAADAAAVAVSVDPRGDTPIAVRRWLRRLRMPSNFHYLVGSRTELAPLWRAYYVAPQPEGEEESRHSASIWMIDAKGRIRTKFSAGAPVPPADIAHDFRILIAEGERQLRSARSNAGGG